VPYGVEECIAAMHLLDEFNRKPLAMVSNFDNANMNRWKFEQFCIVAHLVVVACMCFSCYFSVVGELFVQQIYAVCAVFGLIIIVKILLD